MSDDWAGRAIVPEGEIIDVFSAAGLKQPDIGIEIRSLPALAHCFPRSFAFYVAHPARSILSDGFLAEVRGLKYKNVAAELLAKLSGDAGTVLVVEASS